MICSIPDAVILELNDLAKSLWTHLILLHCYNKRHSSGKVFHYMCECDCGIQEY